MVKKWKDKQTAIITDLILIHSTNAAYLVRNHDGAKIWIPQSLVFNINLGNDVKDSESGLMVKEIDSLEIPFWLAKKNNMV